MDKPVTVITGASKGIGRSIAFQLADEGHNLALFGRNNDLLKTLKSGVSLKGIEAEIYSGDVSDETFVNNSIKDILYKFGKIDNLINSAGILILKELVDTTFEELKKTIETNVYGVYLFLKAVAPGMISKKYGNIINVSSISGKRGFKQGSLYAASKFAVNGMSESIMEELRSHNIRVMTICPGSVNTDMIKGQFFEAEDKDSIIQAEDISEIISTALRLPQSAMISELTVRPTNPK